MAKTIFVNLPVADVAKSTAFYEAIGFAKNAQFSAEHASSMKWSDTITIMLVGHEFYRTLTTKPIADTKGTSGALIALGFDTRAEVDVITEAAMRRVGVRRTIPRISASCTAAPSRISTGMASGRSTWIWTPPSLQWRSLRRRLPDIIQKGAIR